jgi:hypothetical protein
MGVLSASVGEKEVLELPGIVVVAPGVDRGFSVSAFSIQRTGTD